jgi:hypothetical protein
MEVEYVCSVLRTEFFNIVEINFLLQRVKEKGIYNLIYTELFQRHAQRNAIVFIKTGAVGHIEIIALWDVTCVVR